MVHHTKEKGDLGAVMVIADLTMKGYYCFTPIVTEHLPFDIIAYKDNVSYRIQSKYSDSGFISNKNSWSSRSGTFKRKYNLSDFDYYGLYLPNINKCVYPSIKFGGCKIAYEPSNSATPFYWYEDFINFTDNADKKSYKDFNVRLCRQATEKVVESSIRRRKVQRPSKEELLKLLWEKPMTELSNDFGVSDKAIAKWADYYGIEKPPQGYWLKSV